MSENTERNYIMTFVLCLTFAVLMVIGARIKVSLPIGNISVTLSLQIFIASLAGFVLGSNKGAFSILLYVIIGLIGAPVFAYGGGYDYVFKPTFGFIIGFIAAAHMTGYIWERTTKHNTVALFLTALAGELSYYACGLLYYYFTAGNLVGNDTQISLKELFHVWFFSTVIPDYALCLLAGLVSFALTPFISNLSSKNSDI